MFTLKLADAKADATTSGAFSPSQFMHISPKTFSSLVISTVILRLLLKQIAMNTHDYHHHGTGTIGVYYTSDDYRFCGNESTITPTTFVFLVPPLSISFPLLTRENKFNWCFFVFSGHRIVSVFSLSGDYATVASPSPATVTTTIVSHS